MTREDLVELTDDPELLFADGFDAALVGVARRCGQPDVVVYDYDRAVMLLIREHGCSYEDAVEYMEFNVVGAWVGPRTPLWLVTPEQE